MSLLYPQWECNFKICVIFGFSPSIAPQSAHPQNLTWEKMTRGKNFGEKADNIAGEK